MQATKFDPAAICRTPLGVFLALAAAFRIVFHTTRPSYSAESRSWKHRRSHPDSRITPVSRRGCSLTELRAACDGPRDGALLLSVVIPNCVAFDVLGRGRNLLRHGAPPGGGTALSSESAP
jgi:hypothetical protein